VTGWPDSTGSGFLLSYSNGVNTACHAMTSTILALLAVALLLPLIILLWVTETRTQRAKRLRSYGWSQQRIADHLGVSRSTVRRALAA